MLQILFQNLASRIAIRPSMASVPTRPEVTIGTIAMAIMQQPITALLWASNKTK